MHHATPHLLDRSPISSPNSSTETCAASPVVNRLFDEWHHLTISSAALRDVRSWGLPGGPVSSLDDLLARCGFAASSNRPPVERDQTEADPTDEATEDEWLLGLLRLAPTEVLAARIVLQRILPALSSVARRHSSYKRHRLDLMDELVANAWPIICAYPTERRRVRVVPNLVRDITFATIVRPIRRRLASEVPTTIEGFGDPAEMVAIEPLDELVGLLHEAVGTAGMGPTDVEFICQLINHGKPEHLAVALDVSPRTVRNHRDAVVHRLRTMVACAA
ncbi:MAG: hypothetical protein ABIR32_01860 [Ilumatobacteraceae bacterium]